MGLWKKLTYTSPWRNKIEGIASSDMDLQGWLFTFQFKISHRKINIMIGNVYNCAIITSTRWCNYLVRWYLYLSFSAIESQQIGDKSAEALAPWRKKGQRRGNIWQKRRRCNKWSLINLNKQQNINYGCGRGLDGKYILHIPLKLLVLLIHSFFAPFQWPFLFPFHTVIFLVPSFPWPTRCSCRWGMGGSYALPFSCLFFLDFYTHSKLNFFHEH